MLDRERKDQRLMTLAHPNARPQEHAERFHVNRKMQSQERPTEMGRARHAHAGIGDQRDVAHFADRDKSLALAGFSQLVLERYELATTPPDVLCREDCLEPHRLSLSQPTDADGNGPKQR